MYPKENSCLFRKCNSVVCYLISFRIHSLILNGKKSSEKRYTKWLTICRLTMEMCSLKPFILKLLEWWELDAACTKNNLIVHYNYDVKIIVCSKSISQSTSIKQSQWCRIWSRRRRTSVRSGMASFTTGLRVFS